MRTGTTGPEMTLGIQDAANGKVPKADSENETWEEIKEKKMLN